MASRAAAVARRLIQKKGKSVVLRHYTSQTTPLGGGKPVRKFADGRSKSVFTRFGFARVNGSTILHVDQIALFDALTINGVEPIQGDEVFVGVAITALATAPTVAEMKAAAKNSATKQLSVENVETVHDGEDAALFKLHLRG